ncbi:MAG: hypothetical protein DRH51_04305 [Candidatus Coatesbacteria bacterium]|nr:MAG: hypothetical protein DRH51_04305 [Candidatus Coatesbacteria bacterium]RLC41715.1 MAG: hypothetical protein DRH49_04965 [Candidatus Coatesbacteria bacterium]
MDDEIIDIDFGEMSNVSQEGGVKVTIYGVEYNIKTLLDKDYAYKLASYIDRKMWNIAETNKLSSSNKVAIMTALHLAHELFQMRNEIDTEKKKVSERTKNIITTIDKYMSLISKNK